MHRETDTIAAISTAQGEGGIAIVRASGERALQILKEVFCPCHKEIESHKLVYGHVLDEAGEPIDEVMAVFMRAPKTYTREDVLEIHCHGGRICADRVLGRVLEAGARLAEPGEFTKRAFLNGRIDLSSAEAVMQLIGAKSEASMRASVRQLEGGISGFVRAVSERMTDLLSLVEAATDFPEEIDEPLVADTIGREAKRIAAEIEEKLDPRAARIIRDGASVVLAGRPNVGKSSLMNALIRQDRAIVTDIPGTTRDVLTERVELGGLLLELSDTAGIRATSDAIECIGVNRAKSALEGADVVLLVLDASMELQPEDEALLADADERYILCENKCDLVKRLDTGAFSEMEAVCVSAKQGTGIQALTDAILNRLRSARADERMFTAQRQIALAKEAAEHLRACARALQNGIAADAASDDLWRAQRLISEITGEDAEEEVIDAVFRNFCVGK